jgi:hypothetical protein
MSPLIAEQPGERSAERDAVEVHPPAGDRPHAHRYRPARVRVRTVGPAAAGEPRVITSCDTVVGALSRCRPGKQHGRDARKGPTEADPSRDAAIVGQDPHVKRSLVVPALETVWP